MMARSLLRRGRWWARAAWLALGLSILVPVGGAKAAVPESSRVEFVAKDCGCLGNVNVERTVLTQRGDSAFVAVSAWPPRDTELLTSRLPTPVYAAFWDSLMDLGYLNLDSSYRGSPPPAGDRIGQIVVEYSSGGRTHRKKVGFRDFGGFPERFQHSLSLVSGMRVWGELSAERLLDDTTDGPWRQLSDLLRYNFGPRASVPEPAKYLAASDRSAELVKRIFDRSTRTGMDHDFAPGFWGDQRAWMLALFLPKNEADIKRKVTSPEAVARFLALDALRIAGSPDVDSIALLMVRDDVLIVRLFAACLLATRGRPDVADVLLQGLQVGRPWLDAVVSAIVESGDSSAVDSLLIFASQGPPEVRRLLVSEGIGQKVSDQRVTGLLMLSFHEAQSGFDRVGVLREIGFHAPDTALLDSVGWFLMTDTVSWNREFAATAMVRLAQYDRPRSLRVLREARGRWPDDLSLVAAVGAVRDTTQYGQLMTMATTGAPGLRAAAAYALAHFKTAEARGVMLAAIEMSPAESYAIRAFGVWPDARSYARLVQVVGDTGSNWPARMWAVKTLGTLGDKRAIPLLQSIADNVEEGQLCGVALDAIAEIRDPRLRGRQP